MNRKGDRIVEKKEKKRKEKANAKKKKGSKEKDGKEKDSKKRGSKKKDGKKKDGKKKDKANRDDKQRKADFDKGMRKGAAVVSNENLTNQEIKVGLNKLELQYQLKELDAKLAAEKENLQTWILSGKLAEYKRTKKIERKPTKAETEEEVSEADRKKHKKIAAEVKAQLQAKGKSAEGVESFEAFYKLIQQEAGRLRKRYEPHYAKASRLRLTWLILYSKIRKMGMSM